MFTDTDDNYDDDDNVSDDSDDDNSDDGRDDDDDTDDLFSAGLMDIEDGLRGFLSSGIERYMVIVRYYSINDSYVHVMMVIVTDVVLATSTCCCCLYNDSETR